MSFYDQVATARGLLERNGRVSLRGLQRELALDDATLQELVDELVDVQLVALREGNVLVSSVRVAGARPSQPDPAPASMGGASAHREPRAYTPKHLADRILQSRSALEGERKQVTVLFADVKGSMELAEQLDPEEWHQILERFFAILTEGVHRFEGTVNQYTGDGIMALFGAPIAHEDHAQRACYAALALQDALRSYANELRLQRGLNFSARIGLNSGAVIVGRIGDDLRMDYTAQGQTVGLAARMEQIAEPGKVYLTAHTAALVDGYFALNDLGAMEIKGVQGALHVHELQGAGPLRSRLDVSRSRGFSRFVGRGDEMQQLEAALAKAREGNARVVGIVGEAGLGKSRLCFEFLERCRARGLMTYETTGVSHGKSIPFLPILRLFRAFFGITQQDSHATARERIAGRLLLLDERLRESLPLLFDFMGVPDRENPVPNMAPEARQRQLFDVLRRVTQARGQRETSVMLLEDLHWFDGGSAAFLEPLIEASAGTRNLVLLNFRPEYQASQGANWMGKSFYQQLPLAPLGPDAIRELLSALLGNHPSTVGLAEAIHARTAGNPFFTEEVVQNLIETKKLHGTKGAYTLVTPVDKLEVPSTVHSLLAARIDRLADREKNVLQTASVIGREFDEPTLAAVVEMEASWLREALQTLKDAEYIREQSLYPVVEYLFKHPLTQEVALTSQLQTRRRALHAKVARVIEARHATALDEQAALLAHHWEQAADLVQAVRWHRHAAEWSSANDLVEGLQHWRKVHELSTSLHDSISKASRLRACGMLLARSWRAGMSDHDARGYLEDTRVLADELGDPAAMSVALAGMALQRLARGDRSGALGFATEARGMINDRMTLDEVIFVEVVGSVLISETRQISMDLDDFERIIRLVGEDPRQGRGFMGLSPLIWAEVMAGGALAKLGDFDASWPRVERAVRLARELGAGEKEGLLMGLGQLIAIASLARDTSRVPALDLRRAGIECVELAEEIGSRTYQFTASFSLATTHFLSEDYAASGELVSKTAALARAEGFFDGQSYVITLWAEACLGLGDVESAIAKAREGVELADAGGMWFQGAYTRAALADALIHANASEAEIRDVIAEARELVQRSGGKSLLPRLREAEARLAARDDPSLLAAGLHEAEAMYRAMGAPDPADRLARELSP